MNFAEVVAKQMKLPSIILYPASASSTRAYDDIPRLYAEGYIPVQGICYSELVLPFILVQIQAFHSNIFSYPRAHNKTTHCPLVKLHSTFYFNCFTNLLTIHKICKPQP